MTAKPSGSNSQSAAGEQSALATLRLTTRPEHQAIEQVPMMVRLFAADYQLAEYGSLLAVLYGFYNALEPSLFGDLPGGLKQATAHRRKSQLLRQDLLALGYSATEVAHLPRCFRLPELAGVNRRLGVLYVLEGSTLGGQVISRRLRQRFAQQAISALAFYECYGADVGRQWKSFRALLENHFQNQPASLPEAVDAARQTFSSLSDWLQSPGSDGRCG